MLKKLLSLSSCAMLLLGLSTCEPALADGWIFEMDYLYWTPRTPDVEFAITDIGGVQDRGPVGTVLALGGDYSSGYRLGFGKRTSGGNGPEIMFNYTDFDSNVSDAYAGPIRATFISSDNSENDDSDNINSLGVETITPDDRATSVNANFNFDYQTFDLSIGQTLEITDSLNVRVSGGGRATKLDESFNVTYTGGDFQTAYNAFKTTDYQGGGFLLGADLQWHICKWMSLNFDNSLGLILGRIETRTFLPDDEPGVPTDVRYAETRMTPVLEMAMAFNFNKSFGGFDVNFGTGYEMVNWFNMADSRTFTDSHIEAQNAHMIRDLSLDGMFARFTVVY